MGRAKTALDYIRRLVSQLRPSKSSHAEGGYSNFDEERILKEYIGKLHLEGQGRTIVDIGAGKVKGSNTYALFAVGWKGLAVDSDSRRVRQLAKAYRRFPGVSACCCRVTPQNVVPLLQTRSVEREFGILSLDIDGYDYWVLDALLDDYRPRLVVTEINEKIPPPIRFRVRYDPGFRLRYHFYGYSIASLAELCAKHSYFIVELEYNNAFIVPAESPGVGALAPEAAYRRGYLERSDRQEKFPRNGDMEILHTLSPEEGLKFIDCFFSQYRGEYDLSLD